MAEGKQADPEELKRQIEELKGEIRQIKEVLNSILGLLSEEEIVVEDEDQPPSFMPKGREILDPNMLN